METLERNRVFDEPSLRELLSAGTELFHTAIEYTGAYETETMDVWHAINQIPGEAKDAGLQTCCQALISSGTFQVQQYEDMILDLENYLNKLLDNVYVCDSLAAQMTGEIAECVQEVGAVAQEIEELLGGGLLSQNLNKYAQTLAGCQSRWTTDAIDYSLKLLESKTVLKGMQSLCEYSEDPVNLSTGNFVYQKTDLTIAGAHPLSFCRFYNAMDKRKGVFGRGWRHNFESSLLIEGEEITLIGKDGREEKFKKESVHFYRSSVTGKQNLHTIADGYRCMDAKGNVHTYDQSGRLMEVLPAEGGHIVCQYEGDLLVKVMTEAGDSLEFVYERGSLCKISDHTGRAAVFGYDEKSRLTRVEDPCGGIIQYTYGRTGRIETIRDGEGIATVVNEYAGDRRITKQTFPDGGIATYEYKDKKNRLIYTQPNGNRKIYISDGRMRHTVTIHEDGTEYYEYDDDNRCTAYIDKNQNRTSYEYDCRGNVVKVCDALGQEKCMEYDAFGKLTRISYEDGSEKRAVYDSKGRITEVSDEMGAKIRICYESQERTVEIQFPDGSAEEIRYDSRGNIIGIYYPDGRKLSYGYDELNRAVWSKDGNENITKYQYDPCGRLTVLENPEGFCRTFDYNARGDLVRRKNFDGGILKAEYGTDGRLCRVIDEEGGMTSYAYDLMGNITSVTAPEGGKHEFKYNRQNLLEREKKPDGFERQFFYDRQGNCVREIDEAGKEIIHIYDKLNRRITTRLPEGKEITYAYDRRSRLIEKEDNCGYREERSYDGGGRLILVRDSLGEETAYAYNALGRVIRRKTPKKEILFEYAKGGVLTAVHENGKKSAAYTYDRAGNISTITYGDGLCFGYEYDALNRPVRVYHEEEIWKEFSYDEEGRITEIRHRGTLQKQYRYSKTGKLTYAWEAGCAPVSYGYDKEGRLKEMRQEEEKGCGICYRYDPMGRLAEVTDSMGYSEKYSYDCYGNLQSFTDRDGKETKYQISKEGRLLSCILADGGSMELEYDPLGRLRKIQRLKGVLEIGYGQNGKPDRVTDAEGNVLRYFWQDKDRISALTLWDGTHFEYDYAPCGKPKSIRIGEEVISCRYDAQDNLTEKFLPGEISQQFGYDRYGRVTEMTVSDREGVTLHRRYSYSPDGLRTGMETEYRDRNADSCRYRYDEAGRLQKVCLNGTETSYEYDGYGNRIKKLEKTGETVYTYDKNNRLIHALFPHGEIRYEYDHSGRLLSADAGGGEKQWYRYDAFGIPLFGEGTGCLRDIFRREQDILGIQSGEGFQSLCYDYENRMPAALVKDGKAYFYLTDEMGSPLQLTDGEGNRVESMDWNPFGEEAASGDREAAGPHSPIGFHGLPRIHGGYYLAGRRFYDPVTGRLNAEDRIRGNRFEPSGQNLYVYGRNNPLLYADRTGDTPEQGSSSGGMLLQDLEQAVTYLGEAKDTAAASGQYLWGGICSVFGQRQSARGVHSAECGVVVSEEVILAMAGYQEGRELLESVLPEDSYVFRMQQYQDIVNPPDEKGLLELSWDYVKRVAELYLNGFIEGESYFQLHHEETLLVNQYLGELLETEAAEALTTIGAKYTLSGKVFEQIGGVRYLLAGYSYEEAKRLAKANCVENYKNAEKGVLQFFKGIFDLINDPVSLKDTVVGGAEQIWEKVKGITREEALMLLTTNGIVYLINREVIKAAGKSMETYFYADDETAYQTIGRDLGMLALSVIVSEAVKKVKGGGKGGTPTKVTSNLGNEIDITPSSNHSTVPKNPGPKGTPNSSVDIIDDAGNVATRRWYDSNGNAYRDVDMTNHGNPKTHPEHPHEHTWDWSSGNPKRSK